MQYLRTKAAKAILGYLRPIFQYSIDDKQKSSNMLSSLSSLQDDEEDVSYDSQSLFINI